MISSLPEHFSTGYSNYQSNLSEDILWMPPASAFCTSRLLVWTIACNMDRTTCALLTTALQLASFLVRSCISLAASDTVLLSPPPWCCTLRNLTISGSALAVSSVEPYVQCRWKWTCRLVRRMEERMHKTNPVHAHHSHIHCMCTCTLCTMYIGENTFAGANQANDGRLVISVESRVCSVAGPEL